MFTKSIFSIPAKRYLTRFFQTTSAVLNALRYSFRKVSFALILIAFSFDSNSQVISIGSPVNGAEGGSDISFLVFIEGGGINTTGSAITGSLGYSGSASIMADFTGVSSFSIPVGANSTTITIQVIDDLDVESTETVTVGLIGSPSVGTYSNTTSTASLFDNDGGTMFISIGSPIDGAENGSAVSYVISIGGGMINNTGSPILGTLSYSGTATAADFTFAQPIMFTIPDGVNSTLIALPVVDDNLLECIETVTATISNPSIGLIGNAASTANVVDDECAAAGISISNPQDGTEGGSDVTYVVSLDNGLINGTGSSITGLISYSGTAVSGMDFMNVSTFSILPGTNAVNVNVSVLDDIDLECDETVIATISNPSAGTINNATETALIIDDECLQGTISIGLPVDGSEPGTSVTFDVYIDGGGINSTGADIIGSIDFQGTAIEGTDFATGPTNFAIANGASSTQISLAVIDDIIIEVTETVLATISNPNVASIGTATSTANILDDDSVNGLDQMNVVEMSVYPNPVNSTLSFEAEQQMKRYSIIDLNGRLLSTGDINAMNFNLNIEFLPVGSYVVSVLFEDGNTVNKKMLKN